MTPVSIPPSNSQIDRSVGAPVKNRATSELNDSMALMPKMASMMPTTNKAIDALRFMTSQSVDHTGERPVMMRTSTSTTATTSRM